MKIAFDLDDVLADFIPSLLEPVSANLGKSFQKEDMVFQKHYGEVWGVSLQEAIEIVFDFYESEEFKSIPALPNATEVLASLKMDGHELFVITSRPFELKDKTLVWLDKNLAGVFIPGNVYFSARFKGGKRGKGEIAKELGVDLLIEDDLHHIQSCTEESIPVIIMNQPWNQSLSGHPRIRNLNEIFKFLDTSI